MYSSLLPQDEKYITKMKKNSGTKGNTVQYSVESLEAKGEKLSHKSFQSKVDPEQSLILNIRKSEASPSCRDLFLGNVQVFYNISIPKHIRTFDENYVLSCLELIRTYSVRATAWEFTSKMNALPIDMINLAEARHTGTGNMASLAIECPLSAETEVISDWTIGAVSGSQSMMNILKSPLLQQFGSLDCDDNFQSKNVSEPNFVNYQQELSSTSSNKLQKKVTALADHKFTPALAHKKLVSMSSTYSSFSDASSSSSSLFDSSFQGMLECTWKDGLPHYAFTMDDKREVYVANLSEVENPDTKNLDYVYTFHLRKNGKIECDIHKLELESVGKMRVSTSITVCSDSKYSEVRETQFVLSVPNENHVGDKQISTHTLKKNKRLTKKVVDAFRSSHPCKQRSSAKFEGLNAIMEDTLWVPSNDLDPGDANAENKFVVNSEVAAIIVNELYKSNKEEAGLGGWGLKFLKKSGNVAYVKTVEEEPSECLRNTGECSTSMNVVIPAGFHGWPRTRVGGPSSLTDRWISGGRCDCGGWDIGCPLTILYAKSLSADSICLMDSSAECKSIDLFKQGSKQDVPILKMVNIHEGLYYIHFQSTLSTLQSLAIAAAIIHSHNPVLRSKLYRSLK